MAPGNAPDSVQTARERLAEEILGVDAGSSPAAAQAAVLRHILDTDFVPSPRGREAIEVLCGRNLAAESRIENDARGKVAAQLRGEVETFTASFFGLLPGRRLERWQALRAACAADPTLLSRLSALAPGLHVDRSTIEDRSESALVLVDSICEMFVMPPRARAIRRLELSDKLGWGTKRSIAKWPPAANRVKKRHPEIAALEPELLARLSSRVISDRVTKSRAATALTQNAPRSYVWLVIFVVITLSRIATWLPTSQRSSSSGSPAISPAPSERQIAETLRGYIKPALERALRDESVAFDPSRLDRVVAVLPDAALRVKTYREDAPPTSDQAYATAELGRALRNAGITLDEKQLDSVARKALPCFSWKVRATESRPPGNPTK
jgi:hypothetical protein